MYISEGQQCVFYDYGNGIKYCIKQVFDLDKIDDIIKKCDNAFENPISKRGDYQDLVKKFKKNAEVIVACDTDILGYAIMYANNISDAFAYISLFAIRAEYRKIGIGAKLMQKCLTLAKEKGMMSIRLEVRKNNDRAIHFYEKNQFHIICDKENSLILEKAILKGDEL